MLKSMFIKKLYKNKKIWLIAFLGFCGNVIATTLELFNQNIYYGRDDRVDTITSATARRNNFYNNIGLDINNIGLTGLSFFSDVNITNDKFTGFAKKVEIRSTNLQWENTNAGLNISVGRNYVYNFSKDATYLDGINLNYDAGKIVSVSAFSGTNVPSRYSDSILSLKITDLETGFYSNFRIIRGTTLGFGITGNKQIKDSRFYTVGASLLSDIANIVLISANTRFEITNKNLDKYFINADFIKFTNINLALHLAGEAMQIDSINYYQRMILEKYNEIGLSGGLYPLKDLSLLGSYSLRAFSQGLDHLTDFRIFYKGISLLLKANTGVHGTTYQIMPAYEYNYAQIFTLGGGFNYNRYNTELNPLWRDATCAYVFMRFFIPWFAPSINLIVEPQFEYLTNEYYKKDVRVMFMSRLNFSGFKSSKEK